MTLIQRLYRFLLRQYPRDFYARFGDEMATVFDQVWADARGRGRRAAIGFCLREGFGLLVSIIGERWRNRSTQPLRRVLHWRVMPFIVLLAVSIVVAAMISLSYWGYVTLPSTRLPVLKTYDSVALIEIDADYTVTALPIDRLPSLTTELFPPSQILPLIQQRNADISVVPTLDPALAEKLTAALAREAIYLGQERPSPSMEPVLNPERCSSCYSIGVQPQPDGSILEIIPAFEDGAFTGENIVNRVTPNEWWYYRHVIPAGYLVTGSGEDGTPLVFTAISSQAIQGGDHFRYYELIFEDQGDRLILSPGSIAYNYDVAGLEGFGMFMITLVVYIPLLFLWLVVLLLRGMGRWTRRWRLA